MKRAALVAVFVVAFAGVADAYIISARGVFKRFAERQALDRVTSGALVGRAEMLEGGRSRDVPVRLELQLPGSCKALLELPEGTASATLEKGKMQQENAPAALQALVQLGCPFTVLKNVPAGDAETALVRISGSLGVDMQTVSLSRLGRRTAFVVGAKPRELDRPQVWFDKETSRPTRIIAKQAGMLWDVRFEDTISPATGRRAPRVVEVWQKGEKVLAMKLMTAGLEKNAAETTGEDEDDSE